MVTQYARVTKSLKIDLADTICKQSMHSLHPWQKESHLHQFKPIPDAKGNRAERRAASKLKRKKGR